MITPREIEAVAARFGVPDSQVIRDHLISHVIAALASVNDRSPDRVVFIGGTALCRTWCPDLRLSEDIDLHLDTPAAIEELKRGISRELRREFPDHTWTAAGVEHEVDTRILRVRDSTVRIQFVRGRGAWRHLPVVHTAVQLRYSDLPATVDMVVPAPTGFAAMKLMAWLDRHLPRDLYDLAALADAGHVTADALALVKRIAGYTPSAAMLETKVPGRMVEAWQSELGHQVGAARSADECLTVVRTALVASEST